jgi:hypothetical protein
MCRRMGGERRAVTKLRPQPKQEAFLSSPADVCIYGGSAGGGKTWALIYDFLKHYRNPKFGSVLSEGLCRSINGRAGRGMNL